MSVFAIMQHSQTRWQKSIDEIVAPPALRIRRRMRNVVKYHRYCTVSSAQCDDEGEYLIVIYKHRGFGGLGLAYWPLVLKSDF